MPFCPSLVGPMLFCTDLAPEARSTGWLKSTQENITLVVSLGIFSRKGSAYASIWFNKILYNIPLVGSKECC